MENGAYNAQMVSASKNWLVTQAFSVLQIHIN